jgi:hypothetical protein
MSRRMSISSGYTLLVVLTVMASGCIPAVNHGPRIESGWNGGLTASFPLGPRYDNGDWGQTPFLHGPVGVNLARGWRTSGDGGALQLGVHVPAALALYPPGFFKLAQADAYYQLPARISSGFDAGFGVNLASAYVMPYLQVGQIVDDDSGWYTTQGLTVMWDDGVSSNGSAAIFWMPTLAYQQWKQSHTTHWFLTGGIGKEQVDCYNCDAGQCVRPNDIRFVLSAGVSVQFYQKK